MSAWSRVAGWARHPSVLMCVLGLGLYPFVREEKPARVLRLSAEQLDRALARERNRSDAPETAESQARAREDALDEEALAELAMEEELHRSDDGLRLALAQAARRELVRRMPPPTPTDAELHALAAEVPLESLVDADVVSKTGTPSNGLPSREHFEGMTLASLEEHLGVRHLPMPTDAPREASVTNAHGVEIALTLTVHRESPEERFARLRPELERRFVQETLAARTRAALRDRRARYDRTELP